MCARRSKSEAPYILLFHRNISPADETIQWGTGAILGAGDLDLGRLRFKIHLPQEGFVAGVGAEGRGRKIEALPYSLCSKFQGSVLFRGLHNL